MACDVSPVAMFVFDLALPILIEYKYIYLGLIKQADDRSWCWKFLEGVSGVLEGRGGKGEADAPRKPLKTCYHTLKNNQRYHVQLRKL